MYMEQKSFINPLLKETPKIYSETYSSIDKTVSEESFKLLFSKKVKTQFQFNLPPIQLSQLSRSMLDKIIHQIYLGQKSLKGGAITQKILGSNEFPKGKDYNNIVSEIRDEIENLPKIGKKYEFKIMNRSFIVYAIAPNYSIKTSSMSIYRMLNNALKKMYIWLYVATYFSPQECSRELTIYWYLTEHKKILPYNKEEPIDQIHSNTAFTYGCPLESNNIYIFRKEEWFKVFIHESFHSLGLDFSKMPQHTTQTAMFSIFPINCDLRFYETYTEMWAEIIQILFICLENKNSKQIYTQIEEYLQEERLFSLFQCIKILNHNKIKYRELSLKKYSVKYRENTYVFSYYILKSICMFFYNDFIEWCARQNKGTIYFKKTQSNILSLVDFIKDKYNDPRYIDIINKLEQWFSTTNYNGFEMKSLRMSIHDYL